jgi:hypothetical protein
MTMWLLLSFIVQLFTKSMKFNVKIFWSKKKISATMVKTEWIWYEWYRMIRVRFPPTRITRTRTRVWGRVFVGNVRPDTVDDVRGTGGRGIHYYVFQKSLFEVKSNTRKSSVRGRGDWLFHCSRNGLSITRVSTLSTPTMRCILGSRNELAYLLHMNEVYYKKILIPLLFPYL